LFSSVEEFKKYCIGVPFKGVWYFYQVCENWPVNTQDIRAVHMYKMSFIGSFLLFIHCFENVKTVQGYLDLQSALCKKNT
jgi:hypothetical protein